MDNSDFGVKKWSVAVDHFFWIMELPNESQSCCYQAKVVALPPTTPPPRKKKQTNKQKGKKQSCFSPTDMMHFTLKHFNLKYLQHSLYNL